MTLFSQADLEARTGAGASDFLQAGEEMTADQWAAYVVALEKEMVGHGFCTPKAARVGVAGSGTPSGGCRAAASRRQASAW